MFSLTNHKLKKSFFAINTQLFFLLVLFGTTINSQVTVNYSFTGTVQTFVVPCGVTSINVKAWGAGGSGGGVDTYSGAIGGGGAFVQTTLAVTPGQTLSIIVGGGALGGGACLSNSPGGAGGWGNGQIAGARGGNSGSQGCSGGGGGGGGGTGIFSGTTPLMVAGAGGGGSGGGNQSSGAAGGGGGQNGFAVSGCTPGVSGGNTNGNGTNGGDRGNADGAGGGGGGGGYVGGTGGSPPPGCDCGGCGGGGGSSYSAGTGTIITNGSGQNPGNGADPSLPTGLAKGGISSVQGGNGYLIITYNGGTVNSEFSVANVCNGVAPTFVNTSSYQDAPISSYSWDFGDGSPISTAQTPNYTYSTPGTYTVSLTVSNGFGCDHTSTQQITIYPQPIADFTFVESCINSATVFTNTSTVFDPTVSNAWVQNSTVVGTSTNYSNTYTTPGNSSMTLIIEETHGTLTCGDTVTKTFFIHDIPNTQFSGDLNLCLGDLISFDNNSSITTNEPITYEWSVNGNVVTSSTDFQAPSTNAGTYAINLTTTSAFGCTSFLTSNLVVSPIPDAPELSASIVNCPGDPITLSALAETSSTISWTGPLNYTSTSFSNTFPFQINQMGVYSASIVSQFGCPSAVSSIPASILNIYSFDDFNFPNVITPNNDGLNDEFNILNYFQTCDDFTITIFNRWGNLVFEQTQDDTTGFSGKTQSGSDLEEGVYFYKLIFYSGGDQKEGEKTGFIHIVR
ncbi:MAG: PKD domain-containing protein [Flavobacteriales bacterium]|nr:PKD domain-containing protein [Flavobacteriales bacterium]